MKPDYPRLRRLATAFLLYGFVAALVSAPVAAEQAIEGAHFEDRLGTLPVEISLSHNGVSTLDTGILGSVYWDRTGAGGFGANIRATGPPEAGGSLASYVSPRFIQANAAFVSNPGDVARAYGEELRGQLLQRFWLIELGAFLIGGLVITGLFRGNAPFRSIASTRRRVVVCALVVVVGIGASAVAAVQLFRMWEGDDEVTRAYPSSDIEGLSFSNPEALEIAEQVQPFIVKNTDRIRASADAYEAAADASLREVLPDHAEALAPRDGERIVIAEADPQGSQVGTRVRKAMYPLLEEQLGADAFAMRTISGDISSNGTVAEEGFVREESAASGDIQTVAVKGDHDTDITLDQLEDNGVLVPDFELADVEGLNVVAANDPAFKTLFGGMVVNTTGITETELGQMLREEGREDDPEDPLIVLFHQPRSAAGYIGVGALADLVEGVGLLTTPRDDGIPDLPPGAINVGHLHDVEGPWVIWNTDGDRVTWTVVSQLGTSGGVEENPTFNRFSTPFSTPLKTVSVQLQYFNEESGLQTGYAEIDIGTDGTVTITDRVDVGLPGGQPVPLDEVDLTAVPN
ncbi:MAG TPA: hypothetical protein VFO49_16565 [Nocardioides sp.]|nr:hypothetical protein [Nocardioides sp.]